MNQENLKTAENRTQISEKRNMRSKIRYTMSYNNHNDTPFDTSFLNCNQVVIDGDVESNPGPTDNVDKTPKGKGRPKGTPKKNKGFKGTPNKLRKVDEQNIESVDSINTRNISAPLGLKNYPNQNVCFFNSVIQVLFSVESFREHIRQLNTIDPIVLTIKNLFRQIECSNHSNTSIETYLYVQSLELPDYQPGLQFDAHECLIHILNLIYLLRPDNSVPDESVFQISSLQSILCQTCNNASENTLLDTICPISFPDPYRMNSIQNEIDS